MYTVGDVILWPRRDQGHAAGEKMRGIVTKSQGVRQTLGPFLERHESLDAKAVSGGKTGATSQNSSAQYRHRRRAIRPQHPAAVYMR